MTKERALTQLRVAHVNFMGADGYLEASWERADGTRGKAVLSFLPSKAERWHARDIWMREPTAEKLRDVPLARIEAAVNANPSLHEWLDQAIPPAIVPWRRSRAAQRPRLERPARRRLDDSFFQQVADAYQAAVANGLPPSKTLAAESETPAGTVNRWIGEARARGLLPPSAPGKAAWA
jgi:hypothetical protein